MKSFATWAAMLLGALVTAAVAAPPAGYPLQLLDNSAPAYEAADGVSQRDGILVLPAGDTWLRTHHRHQDFALEFQWRPPADQPWAGSLAFGSDASQHTDDPCAQHVDLPRPGERSRLDSTDPPPDTQIEPGQWNRVRLQVVGGEARLEINGALFWRAEDLTIRPGRVEIRSGPSCSAPLEVRDVRIVELGHRGLFNGRDLSDWEGAGSDADQCWAVRDGILLCTGEKGPWLRSVEQFDDFNLRLEYRVNDAGNSGVYIRVPPSGNHHGDNAGIEVQLLDDAAERYKNLKPYQYSASLYAIVPAEPRVSRPAGQWNTLEIDCSGTSYRVTHNGCDVVQATADDFPALARRLVAGHVGLQNHREEVYFRHLRIGPSLTAADDSQPEPAAEASATDPIDLFNGRNLDGWMVKCRAADRDKNYWHAIDGTITADVPPGSKHDYIWLLTEREFGDFDLRLKVQTYASTKGNSGIQVRSRYDDEASWLNGPQVDIHPPGPWRNGFIYDETWEARIWLWPDVGAPANARPEHAPEGWTWTHADDGDHWNDVRIVCQGTRIQSIINGVLVADYDGAGRLDDEAHRARNVGLKGHVGLQIHPGGQMLIRFKDIQLRQLPGEPAEGT
jgi:hypothetical protein